MVRPLSRFAAAAVACAALLFSSVCPSSARAIEANSLSALRGCLEVAAQSGRVECEITEPVTITTSGSTALTALWAVTLPSSVKLDATITFKPTGCIVWNHVGGVEPTNTTSPVRILEITAGGSVTAGSRLRIDSPCIVERRDGADDGGITTSARGLVFTGAGAANVNAEILDAKISIGSLGVASAESVGFVNNATARASQPASAATAGANGDLWTATNPAQVQWGFGSRYVSPTLNGAAETYPGSGVSGQESNNLFGWFYNRDDVGAASPKNPFEYAVDYSFETAFRSTGGTGSQTWHEWNWDFTPPDFSSPLTGSTGTFVAGDVLSFSGGGSGRVVSVSGSNPTQTLVYLQDFGTSAAGQTVTNITRAGGGTLGALTSTGTTRNARPFLFVFKTHDLTSSFNFFTQQGQATPTLGISSGFVKTNGNVVVSGTNSAVYGPTLWAISNASNFDTGDEVCAQNGFTCQDVLEFGTPATPTDSTCATALANAVKFLAMCK